MSVNWHIDIDDTLDDTLDDTDPDICSLGLTASMREVERQVNAGLVIAAVIVLGAAAQTLLCAGAYLIWRLLV